MGVEPRVVILIEAVGMENAKDDPRLAVGLDGDREIHAARLPIPDAPDDLTQLGHSVTTV